MWYGRALPDTPSFLLLSPGPGFVGVDVVIGEGVDVGEGVDGVGVDGYRRWSLQVVKVVWWEGFLGLPPE